MSSEPTRFNESAVIQSEAVKQWNVHLEATVSAPDEATAVARAATAWVTGAATDFARDLASSVVVVSG